MKWLGCTKNMPKGFPRHVTGTPPLKEFINLTVDIPFELDVNEEADEGGVAGNKVKTEEFNKVRKEALLCDDVGARVGYAAPVSTGCGSSELDSDDQLYLEA